MRVDETPTPPQRLTCHLQATGDGGNTVAGDVVVESVGVDAGVNVSWYISGLAPTTATTPHHFHVHQAGNVLDVQSAKATLGHFNGSCSGCRPAGVLQEVGNIGDNFALFADAAGVSQGSFVDTLPQLRGSRTIVGRSIVVHGIGADAAVRVAQCVLGVDKPQGAPACPNACGGNGVCNYPTPTAPVCFCEAVCSTRARTVNHMLSSYRHPQLYFSLYASLCLSSPCSLFFFQLLCIHPHRASSGQTAPSPLA